MIIYIDNVYKCHAKYTPELTEVNTPFFDGKCSAYIEGYRFVPIGARFIDDDGITYDGESIFPWKNYNILANAQEAYEEAQVLDAEVLSIITEGYHDN